MDGISTREQADMEHVSSQNTIQKSIQSGRAKTRKAIAEAARAAREKGKTGREAAIIRFLAEVDRRAKARARAAEAVSHPLYRSDYTAKVLPPEYAVIRDAVRLLEARAAEEKYSFDFSLALYRLHKEAEAEEARAAEVRAARAAEMAKAAAVSLNRKNPAEAAAEKVRARAAAEAEARAEAARAAEVRAEAAAALAAAAAARKEATRAAEAADIRAAAARLTAEKTLLLADFVRAEAEAEAAKKAEARAEAARAEDGRAAAALIKAKKAEAEAAKKAEARAAEAAEAVREYRLYQSF